MADQILTQGTELAALSPEVWSAKLYEALKEKFPFMSVVSREYEGEIKALGDIIHVPSIPLAAEAELLSEGSKGDADSLTVTDNTITINRRPYKDFIVTKKAQLQSVPFMDELRDIAIHSIMQKVEADIVGTISPSASAPDHQITYDSGTTLQLADILEAKELLDDAGVPQEDRHMCLGSEQYNDLYNINAFTSKDFGEGEAARSGVFGQKLVGFMPHLALEAEATAYLFHKSFMQVAMQQELDIKVYDLGGEGKRASRLNVDLLVGISQFDDERVVSIS